MSTDWLQNTLHALPTDGAGYIRLEIALPEVQWVRLLDLLAQAEEWSIGGVIIEAASLQLQQRS